MTWMVGLGAGGHARVVLEILQLVGNYELVGLLDPKPELLDSQVLGAFVLGDDGILPKLYSQGVRHALIGLGGTGDTKPRRQLYEKALREGFQPVDAIHPQAVVSPSAQMGIGLNVMAGALINSAAVLGDNVIVNTGAIVEHGCIIGDHAHIATGARLASAVRVGIGAHIGVGASVRQGITIGDGAIVGAGAAVVKDVEPGAVVVGVPAQVLKRRGSTMKDQSGSNPSGTDMDSTAEKATQ